MPAAAAGSGDHATGGESARASAVCGSGLLQLERADVAARTLRPWHTALIGRLAARPCVHRRAAVPERHRVRLSAVVPQLLEQRIGPLKIRPLGEPTVPETLQVVALRGVFAGAAVVLLTGIAHGPRRLSVWPEGGVARDDRVPDGRPVEEERSAAARAVEAPVPGNGAERENQLIRLDGAGVSVRIRPARGVSRDRAREHLDARYVGPRSVVAVVAAHDAPAEEEGAGRRSVDTPATPVVVEVHAVVLHRDLDQSQGGARQRDAAAVLLAGIPVLHRQPRDRRPGGHACDLEHAARVVAVDDRLARSHAANLKALVDEELTARERVLPRRYLDRGPCVGVGDRLAERPGTMVVGVL